MVVSHHRTQQIGARGGEALSFAAPNHCTRVPHGITEAMVIIRIPQAVKPVKSRLHKFFTKELALNY